MIRCNRTMAVAATLFALLAPFALGATQAQAQVLEAFDYAVGSTLDGQNGGTGFSNGWYDGFQLGTFSETIGAGSLAYGSLTTSGNRYDVASTAVGGGTFVVQQRNADGANTFSDGSTVFFSFLVNATTKDTANNSYFGLALGSAFIGGGGGFYGLGQAGQATTNSAIADTIGVTRLLVLRADFAAGNDTMRLYIDPVAGVEPVVADVTRTDFDLGSTNQFQVTWGQGGGASFDEMRLGTSFASVTPGLAAAVVPEAGAVSLMLSGAALGGSMLVRRRRK